MPLINFIKGIQSFLFLSMEYKLHQIIYTIILFRKMQYFKFLTWYKICLVLSEIFLNEIQSMPGRNWCTRINPHMCPCLPEPLLLISWNGTCHWKFVYLKYSASCSWSMSNVSFRIKQNKAELWKQNVKVTSVADVTPQFLLYSCYNKVHMQSKDGNNTLAKDMCKQRTHSE